MADEPAGATPEPAPAATPEPAPAKDEQLGEAGQKALDAFKTRARDAETRIKELEPLAAKAQELEDAQKSEVEKLTGKVGKADQRAATAEAKLLRYEVAAEKEVPAKLVPLLTAADKEGLEAQADLILENAKAPTPEFDGGAREPAPAATTPTEDHNKLAVALFGGTQDKT